MPENRSPYGLLVVGSAPGLRPIVNSSTSAPSVHRETQLSHPTPSNPFIHNALEHPLFAPLNPYRTVGRWLFLRINRLIGN